MRPTRSAVVCPSAVGIVLAWVGWSSYAAYAHHVDLTEVHVLIRADRSYEIDVFYDANLLVVEAATGNLTAEERARLEALTPEALTTRLDELRPVFDRRLTLRFDGVIVHPAIGYRQPTERGRTLVLSGTAPPGARELVFWASRTFGTVPLTVNYEGSSNSLHHLLDVAERSPPIPLDAAQAAGGDVMHVAARYLILGFEHILPKGLDHILFVLGLFLLSTRWGPLLWQVTAFTVAHSITLALAMYGVVSLSPSIVEPLIALSIAYVALENVCTSNLKPWRPVVIFAFGLLHGLGFAGVLTELGLPRGDFATALIAFNVGVEAGQLAVIALAFLVVGWCRGRAWYRLRLAVPASLAIAAVALYWTVERTLAG